MHNREIRRGTGGGRGRPVRDKCERQRSSIDSQRIAYGGQFRRHHI